jgi:TPR repeat protein
MTEVNEDKECPVCFEDFISKIEGNSNIKQASHAFCCGKLICVSCWSAMDAASTTGLGAPCPYCRAPRPSAEERRVLLLGHAERGKKAWAQCKLGSYYREGRNGFPQCYELAAHWISLAADQGYIEAQYNLGNMYYNGEGVAQSYEKAAELYTLSAEGGNASARFNLGLLYSKGEGVAQSYEKAAELYTLAAEEGNASARYYLGLMYYKGEGVAQSYEKAVELYTLAAEGGNASARYMLGLMYYEGQGVAPSNEKSVEILTLAVNQGHEGAIAALPVSLLTLVNEGRIDLICESVYRMKIALKLASSKLPDPTRCLYLSRIEKAALTCGGCGRMKKDGEGVLSLCKGCRCIYYCNRECQKAHWKEHKAMCKRISS